MHLRPLPFGILPAGIERLLSRPQLGLGARDASSGFFDDQALRAYFALEVFDFQSACEQA
jgi:hypothetical protein